MRAWPSLLLPLAATFVAARSFFIRSYIPPDKSCNTTAGHECFNLMFNKMSEVCSTTSPLTFKCIHYHFLDECFNKRVGYCETSDITNFARAGFNEAQRHCPKNAKTYREVVPISQQFGDIRQRLSDPQIIATLGYLQTQCSIIRNVSCSSDQMDTVFDKCEHEIRSRSTSPTSNDFDRHKLLRIKLDASRKLLSFTETEDRLECLMVRWALTEIFKIHQQHCFHSTTTRCLCERGKFDKRCKINCEALEVRPPVITEEDWEHLRESLHRNVAAKIFTLFPIFIFFTIFRIFPVV